MRKILIALSLATTFAAPAMALDKSGFAIGLGMNSYNGDLGKELEHSKHADDTVFSVQVDHTFENGVIIGGMYSPKKDIYSDRGSWGSDKDELTNNALYMGYQFDNGARVKLGSAMVKLESEYKRMGENWDGSPFVQESGDLTLKQRGLYLGLGWVAPVGIYADFSYTRAEIGDFSDHYGSGSLKGGFSQFTVGYKF